MLRAYTYFKIVLEQPEMLALLTMGEAELNNPSEPIEPARKVRL